MTPVRGTWRLTRLALRRDRLILPVWILAIAAITWAVVASHGATLTTEAERVATAMITAENPMARIFDGPASGTSPGAMAMVEAHLVLALLTALMASQTLVRHTRTEEESGRAELVGSSVVGRHAPLAAALIVTLGAGLALGAAVALALGLQGLGWAGAWAQGAALTGTAWAFAGIAAVAAQVLSTARGANAISVAALGAAFLLRAVGDLTGEVATGGLTLTSSWPSWLSPLGWGQQIRPYHEDNWWVLALFAGLTIVLLAVTIMLRRRRDTGAGMVPARLGPSRAGTALLSPLGLAWRLQRGILAAWLTGMTIAGAVFGSAGQTFAAYLAENDQIRSLLEFLSPGSTPLELYHALVMALLGMAAAGYTVQALLRTRGEETSGRLEAVLATATGRSRWLTGHLLIAGGGTVAVLSACGLAGGLAHGAATGEWGEGIAGLVSGALSQAPAALALGGFCVAAFGLLPRWAAPMTWSALAVAFVMGQFGALFELPQWLLNVSPFTHVPAVPAEPMALAPIAWLALVGASLGAAGVVAFRRRGLVTIA